MLASKYNRHKDDEKAQLTLKLVSGPHVQENFEDSDVLATFTRNAAETEDFKDTKHIVQE